MVALFIRRRGGVAAWLVLSAALSCAMAQAQNVNRELRAPATVAAAPGSANYDLGFRDGYHQQPYRDRDRSNQAYGDGYKAGEARRAGGADAGSDYDTGYRDGLYQLPYRDRDRSNKAYGDGYRAAEAQRRAGGAAGGGSAYDEGFRDGYNKQAYRDKDRSNQAYGKGFQAGEAQRQAAPAIVAAPVAAPASADYQSGYRDALNKQAYRDRDRSNKAYANGYKAGQARGVTLASSGPDYELGFRDAFNKVDYRDRDRNNKRYAEGYKAGQTERDTPAAAATRPGQPLLTAVAPPTRANDLIGRSAAELDSGMKLLGYTRYGGFTKGRESFATWGGAAGNPCVRSVVRDGKVTDVTDMGDRAESSSCR